MRGRENGLKRNAAPTLRIHEGSEDVPMSVLFLMRGEPTRIVGPSMDSPPRGTFASIRAARGNGHFYFVREERA